MKTNKIYKYMKSRASFEKMEFKLDKTFFEAGFVLGVRNFFGVELNNKGNLLNDVQQPEFFKKYKALN